MMTISEWWGKYDKRKTQVVVWKSSIQSIVSQRTTRPSLLERQYANSYMLAMQSPEVNVRKTSPLQLDIRLRRLYQRTAKKNVKKELTIEQLDNVDLALFGGLASVAGHFDLSEKAFKMLEKRRGEPSPDRKANYEIRPTSMSKKISDDMGPTTK